MQPGQRRPRSGEERGWGWGVGFCPEGIGLEVRTPYVEEGGLPMLTTFCKLQID